MTAPKIPLVKWRDGRPRFSPGPSLRAAGHAGKDLRHDDGRWFTAGEALDWSVRFRANLAPRPQGRPRKGKSAPARMALAKMVEAWQASPLWSGLAPATKRDYRQKLRVIEEDHWVLWSAPAAAITRQIMRSVYEEIWQDRGLATARGSVAALSAAFSWASLRGIGGVKENPCFRLKMDMPKPRVRFATRAMVDALVRAADAAGRPEIGDSVIAGVWTGQRQSDRLALQDRGLLKRRRVFRQSKTGAIVHVLEAPELEARLAKRDERRRAANIVSPLLILDERHWQPFKPDHYRHVFAGIRQLAIDGSKQLRLKPCPELRDFRDQDLRDTAVTWMALAGATIPEIVSVTGHTTESATRILKHYLARHPEMADAAIAKMVAWYDAGGETEIGL